MRISVGMDIAKDIHWVAAIDGDGLIHIDRKVENTPRAIADLIEELRALGGTVRIGLDVVAASPGSSRPCWPRPASLWFMCRVWPINRARQGTVGGENKSDPRDARTIADQVRTRTDLRTIEPAAELDLEIRLLVSRRRDLVDAQTQRLARMHDLLTSIFPGLERSLDLTTKGPLQLLTRYVTPAELREAGRKRILRHLKAGGTIPRAEHLADRALEAAAEQTLAVPAERMSARLIRELATEALAAKTRLAEIDREGCLYRPDKPHQGGAVHGTVETKAATADQSQLDHPRRVLAVSADLGLHDVHVHRNKHRIRRRRQKSLLLLQLTTPGIDLLPRNIVSLRNISNRRSVDPNRHDNLELLFVAPTAPTFLPKNLDTHHIPRPRHVANDVAKHVS